MASGQKFYDACHRASRPLKKVPRRGDFTYRNHLCLFDRYLRKVTTILDIGSGVGTLAFYLGAQGKRVDGVEISANAVQAARAGAANLGLSANVSFFRGNFLHWRPSRVYEAVILSEVLEHLVSDDSALATVYNLLPKNGLLILSTPSKSAPLFRLGLLENFDRRVGHRHRYSPDELIRKVQSHGFQVLEVRKTEGILRNFLFTNTLAGNFIRFCKGPLANAVTLVDNLTIPLFGESQIFCVSRRKERLF
jgi:2-polyprenyl-3-methyl-5-hydroxy-6-metoxy-1,4-benzoquinol methylase